MYALTSGACVLWLIQSLIQANNDGSLFNWATIVLSLCLLVVIAWSTYCAITGWNAKDEASTEADAGKTAKVSAEKTDGRTDAGQ
jgi:heme/copper-type cytochrome/quinol oxidase subunit 2